MALTRLMEKNKFVSGKHGFVITTLLIVVLLILYIGYLSVTRNPEIPQTQTPILYYIQGEKPLVQINFNWSAAEFFNIYRATNPNGPWIKIIDHFLGSSHTAVDFDFPKNTKTLYYRVAAINKGGTENAPSGSASIEIP